MSEHTVLIIGGKGKTGGRVNARLQSRGIATRPVSRFGGNPLRLGIGRRPGRAPSKAYPKPISPINPTSRSREQGEAIAELGHLANAKGLQQVVLLSGRGEPSAQRAEAALQASGVNYTIVRASWFNQNFSEGYLIDGVLAGEIMLPAGPVPEPFVDADDIADVAAAAIIDERHVNKLYELTGPRALTFAEAVGEIAAAAKRPIRYSQISAQDFALGMRQAEVPEEIITLLNELFAEVLDGRNSRVMHGVEEALGRPARDFSDFARATASAGVWGA